MSDNITDKDIYSALEETVTIKLCDLNTSIRIATDNYTENDRSKYYSDPHIHALVYKLRVAFNIGVSDV